LAIGSQRQRTHDDAAGEHHRDCGDEAQTDDMPSRHCGFFIWGGHAPAMQAKGAGHHLKGPYGTS
jgi:hypothetical protein